MELLSVLEQKVTSLVQLVQTLKHNNAKLEEENAHLKAQLQMLERSLNDDVRRLEELDLEKSLTKESVNNLIETIRSLVEPQ